jgi:transcriptional/translational regulatory protein YebC/TACO1
MPKEKIQNAVRKGESGGATLHKFEVTTPGGAALIGEWPRAFFVIPAGHEVYHCTRCLSDTSSVHTVEGEADKRDQVYSELQTIMNKRQCQVAKEGSVAWMFRHCGVVRVDLEKIPGELDLDEIAIECEAEDIQVDVGQLMVSLGLNTF